MANLNSDSKFQEPLPLKRRRVISEEEYLKGLFSIIEQQYFPYKKKMQLLNEYISSRNGEVLEQIMQLDHIESLSLGEYFTLVVSEDNWNFEEVQAKHNRELIQKHWWTSDKPLVHGQKLSLLPGDNSQEAKQIIKENTRMSPEVLESLRRPRDIQFSAKYREVSGDSFGLQGPSQKELLAKQLAESPRYRRSTPKLRRLSTPRVTSIFSPVFPIAKS